MYDTGGPKLDEANNQVHITENMDLHAEVEGSRESIEAGGSGLIGLSTQIPKVGDIKVEYHPHSGKGTHFLNPKEFKVSFSDNSEPTEPPDDQLWCPFQSREDFEFAELVHDAALNRTQIKKAIKLV
ncbi:hypothetical protein BDM02DRAFT_3132889 [Thelephora ganbajun]|uniref:Uncharacterized protein n=1 Tax=Thelephora ganbajun TaxID=370292 RepID=A0ACB6YZ81_THEGA|nr:hypothetical protein BDM02DRAFT_3132889 [Thelephora ganbajun]